MKKILTVAMASCLALSAATMAACNGNKNEGENTLKVYVLNAGYDVDWLDGIEKAFVAESWVKEKYGKVHIDVDENGEDTYAADKIKSGEKSNKYDVLFGMNLQDLYGKSGSNKKYYLADLKDVYEATVPGESVTVKDKMIGSAVSANLYTNAKGEASWYAMPWAGGYNGILYNAEKLSADKVPVTTNELLAIMADETAKNGYAVMQSLDEGATYWEHLMPTWWAQYEGYEAYTKFWEGKAYNKESGQYEYSKEIFAQQGRLETLTVLENVLRNNLYKEAPSTDYMTAQRMFLTGEGLFMACGDWFDMEMAQKKADMNAANQKVYNVQMMKTPVVSAIINKLSTVKDDATLAAVVRAVDKGETSYEGVSEEDFKAIKEARNILYSVGNYHTAVIPSYAKNMDLAKDFLKYLATDKANEIYTEKTDGSGMFYKYDVKTKNPTLYNSLSDTAKLRIDCFNNPDSLVLPIPNNYNMFIYGKVRSFEGVTYPYEYLFTQTKTTAKSIYDQDIAHYEDKWDNVLAQMGVL